MYYAFGYLSLVGIIPSYRRADQVSALFHGLESLERDLISKLPFIVDLKK